MVIDAKNRIVILNEGTGMKFDDAVELCHRLGGQLPQVSLNEGEADDADFLGKVMKYTKEDKEKGTESERAIWLGSKKEAGEEQYVWLRDPLDTVKDPNDESWKQMNHSVPCSKDDTCALTIGPPVAGSQQHYNILEKKCDDDKVRVLCRMNIDLRDIPTHGTVDTLIKSAEEIKTAVEGVEEETEKLKQKQDEIEKSEVLKDVKASVEEIKLEIDSMKKTIEADKNELETTKKDAQDKVDSIKKDVEKNATELTEKVTQIDKGIEDLNEKLQNQMENLEKLLSGHTAQVDQEIKDVEGKVTKTEKLAEDMYAKIQANLTMREENLLEKIKTWNDANNSTLEEQDKRVKILSGEWEALEISMNELWDTVKKLKVDDDLKERADTAVKKVKQLSDGLGNLETKFNEKMTEMEKNATEAASLLEELKQQSDPVELKKLKDDVQKLSDEAVSDQQSLQGLKTATWVLLSFFGFAVILLGVFLYRKDVLPKFNFRQADA